MQTCSRADTDCAAVLLAGKSKLRSGAKLQYAWCELCSRLTEGTDAVGLAITTDGILLLPKGEYRRRVCCNACLVTCAARCG